MASGVKVADECSLAFERVKASRTSKFCLFKLNDKLSEVVIDQECPCNVNDNRFDSYEGFMRSLPDDECRYGVFDYSGRFTTDKRVVEKIVFVAWAPGNAKMKHKMVHASSLSAVTSKLKVSDVLQANDKDDLSEESICSKAKVDLDKEHCKEQYTQHPFRPAMEQQ